MSQRLDPRQPLLASLRGLATKPAVALDAFGPEWVGMVAASAIDGIAALSYLVEQIDKCNPVDDHGHDFKLNVAYVRAKELL